jgi:hypothetical protein
MTRISETKDTGTRNNWRIARWSVLALLLLTPLAMMQISDEWQWNFGGFIFAGTLLGGAGLLYELAEKASASRAYRAGASVALLASFLIVWTTIVRDDGNAMSFFLVILAAAVGGFAALFEPAGLARTMLGVAILQALLGIAMATAPVIASQPDGSLKALIYCAFFTALWLLSAALFRAAAKKAKPAAILPQPAARSEGIALESVDARL